MVILSYEMIDELADQILTDYFGTPRFPLKKIDVDAFAKNYLKLDVAYDQLCYGGEIIYAVTAYKDSVVGLPKESPVVFKKVEKDTILLDNALNAPRLAPQRAFTMAHECGHHAIAMLAPDTIKSHDFRSDYVTRDEINEYWREWQANTFASALLMPRYLVESMMLISQHPEKFVIYDDKNVLEDERAEIRKLANMLGVSYTALLYRLKKLNLVERYSYQDYIYDAADEIGLEGTLFGSFCHRSRIPRTGPKRARPATGGILVNCG